MALTEIAFNGHLPQRIDPDGMKGACLHAFPAAVTFRFGEYYLLDTLIQD
jgi:hypothetical protein